MANFPKELTDLVEEYLTDGIISAKERQVLLKKAVNMGVDEDEFDLYLDAQQQKVDQVVDAAASKKRGKTCPFCGGTLPQLTDKCPHCGETVTAEASEELQEIFDHLEEALVDFKSGKDIAKNKAVVERYVRKAKMYYENNPKVQKLLAEVQAESEKASTNIKKTVAINAISSIAKGKWRAVKLEIVAAVILIAGTVCIKSYYGFMEDYHRNTALELGAKYGIDGTGILWDSDIKKMGKDGGECKIHKEAWLNARHTRYELGEAIVPEIILSLLIIGITVWILTKKRNN